MNISKYISVMAIALAAGFSSCSDDFDRPPVIVPEATIEVNTTIRELKERYYADASSMPEIGLTESGERIVIGGRVVTSDEMGNIYQRIIIDDGTAAIPIRVYATSLYETYHYGQEVRIDVTGLLFGNYNDWYMIGVDYNGGIGGMDKTVMTERAQVNGLPDVSKIPVYEISIADVSTFTANDTEKLTWQSRSVTLKDVSFVGAGQLTYGTAGADNYTTRKLTDATGATLDISTSNKCNFAGTTMPTGTGSVTATLSMYRGAWQIVISNPATDVVGFDEMGENPVEPGTPDDAPAQISADFESGALPTGWTETVTSGNRNWQVKQYNSNYYAQCSAYNGTAGTDGFKSWLITSAVDFDKMTEKTMSFETEIQYTGVSDLQLYVMTSADPSKAEMTELTFTKPEPTATGSSTGYLFSGEIDLSQFSGVNYVAWLYTATDPAESRTYRIDNVKIGFKADQQPELPDTPVTGSTLYTGLDENAATIDWTLTNTDIWKWAEYSGKHYLNVSAYQKPEFYGQVSYAESPVIDLTSATKAKLTFDHAAKFQTTLQTLCGVCARVEGDTEWTMLTIPTWPAAGSWTFVSSGDIDLSAFAGKKIQIAFKYDSSAEGADQWEIKNVKITE